MSDDQQLTPSITEQQEIGPSDAFISVIRDLIAQDNKERIQELCRELAPADIADLLTKIARDERHQLIQILGTELDPETFSYLDRETLNTLLDRLPGPQIAAIVNQLDSDDAISLIGDLDEDRRGEIMRSLSRSVRAQVEEGLTYPDKSAGRMMQRECVAVPQFWTVGKTVDYLRAAADSLPHNFYDLFIVDPMHRFIGTVSLSHILCARRETKIDALVHDERVTITVETPQEQIAHLFRRKDLLSAPVVDDDSRLVGVITVDDVVDVIHEEAGEDLLKLGGVSDSDITRPAFSTVRARFWWLAVNLLTAFADTFVISLFEGTIEKVVALAALMPVVASMGGNAGTQTLAVTVRGLATRELTATNAWRVIGKEIVVGGANGLLFGAIMIAIIVAWYGNVHLGLVMGAAMFLNLLAAGFSGVVIPIWLHRLEFDPAHSGSVFLTTVTDVVAFFAFLGLASLFLI